MTKQQLDAIITKLAEDYPDSDTLLSVECFADWLTKYQRETPEGQLENWRMPQLNSTITAEFRRAGLSPTGRKPSQPEYQSFRPSSLPKWECRYNKDRTPTEVYKATAEQVINQSRSYPSNPVAVGSLTAKQVSDMMETEWVHEHNGVVTAFCPPNAADKATLCNGFMSMGTLYVRGTLHGEDAMRAARAYLFKLGSPAEHTCNWVQKGSKVYCTICEGK